MTLAAALMMTGAAGCGNLRTALLSRDGAYLCRHCDCLMSKDTDLEGVCPVCDCGKTARECLRGGRE